MSSERECFVYVQMPASLEVVTCGRYVHDPQDEAGLSVAKFPARTDRWNHAAVEAAMLRLAARCGIRVPEIRVERVGDESVLLLRRDWRLAPAYDLVPSPQPGKQERSPALVCGHYGRAACRENLLSAAPPFGLTTEDAGRVIDHVADVIGRYWRAEVFAHGGTEGDCAAIEPAFLHGGFEYPVDGR